MSKATSRSREEIELLFKDFTFKPIPPTTILRSLEPLYVVTGERKRFIELIAKSHKCSNKRSGRRLTSWFKRKMRLSIEMQALLDAEDAKILERLIAKVKENGT